LTIENETAGKEYEAMLLNRRNHAMGFMERIHHGGTEAQRGRGATKIFLQKKTKETKIGQGCGGRGGKGFITEAMRHRGAEAYLSEEGREGIHYRGTAAQRGQASRPGKEMETGVAVDGSAIRLCHHGRTNTLKKPLSPLARGEGM
jgi:hypothetical protein